MTENEANDPIFEMYIFESAQSIEQMEAIILYSEEHQAFTPEAINGIFRYMHTLEDLFSYLRDESPRHIWREGALPKVSLEIGAVEKQASLAEIPDALLSILAKD